MRLIDADEFIEALEDLYQQAGWDRREVHFSLADTICNLDMMPTVEAEPVRHGKWIGGDECSACGHHGCASDIWNGCANQYCPNCGAKMDAEEDEE